MENEKLAREVETQAIFLARQIILLDLNFFKNNKTLYQKYDFFHKFQDYTLSGKSLSYTILKEYPIDKLYHLLKSINSINNFIRIDLPLNFNEQILTELNKDLKNIIEISNENYNDNNHETIKSKSIDIIDIEALKHKLKILDSNILILKHEIDKLDTLQDQILIEEKKEILDRELKKRDAIKNELTIAIEYSKNERKIYTAIQQLNIKSDELTISKKYYEEQREHFNKYAETAFKTAGAMFGLYVVMCYVVFLFEPLNLNLKEKNLVFYLLLTFPIIFPTFLGFLFIRQSNIKSSALNKLNDKFILIHDVNQSLIALLLINQDTDITKKTEKIIYKLIDNILNNNIKSIQNESNLNNLTTINENFDKTIDTINKKTSIFNDF
ncbi:hypothetical protein ACNO6Z_07385 [Aliarcobacter lanthieri]|uniref:hypothetical protein n=2 Tax=Campylobacterales TaxID=213849 RepID=UPI000DE8A5A9|nr:hypothetical protein [Arcobacter sp. CECT 9188]RBQ26526.1 hypothetical protein CRU88_06480 [Arcobacter sp. CECT 9188]